MTDIRSAVEHVERIIKHRAVQKGARDDVRVTVHTWPDYERGPRVAEVSLFYPDPNRGEPFGSGEAYMQSEPECAPVILAAERLILALLDSEDDVVEEWSSTLLYLMFGR